MESKTHRKERLRLMRKKFHLGEFRKAKRKVYKVKHSNKSMVFRRKAKRKSHSGGSSFNVWNSLIGVGGVIAYKVFLSQYIPISGQIRTIAEIGVGIWLSKKKGIIGNTAKALVIINAYQLLAPYIAQMIPSTTGGASQLITYY